ncbi:hypothetical protein KR222_004900 [Zaprionus bogoriensis]|nr:hypothetical protein KR222_004900 [Zaprionus bogoriensis]
MNLNAAADPEDHQLNNNLQLLNLELCSLVDSEDSLPTGAAGAPAGILRDMNRKFDNLKLDETVPDFEFHGYGCAQTLGVMPKRTPQSVAEGNSKKKTKPNKAADGQCSPMVQKENMWQPRAQNMDQACLDELLGIDSEEENEVERLLELFKSLHEQIGSDLPCNQPNSVPSDYFFELPRQCSMPKGNNIRHHVQVLCTKTDNFLGRLRRQLEQNRCFDYMKYTECSTALNEAGRCLLALKQYGSVELRQRSMQFISQLARSNAARLETVLLELREVLKTAHIFVHVFNWEMDLEHRYSAAMTARHEATNRRALELAAKELQAPDPLALSAEEQYIADHYQMENVVRCAKEREDFLTMLLESPEAYFPPEIIALCDPPKNGQKLPAPVDEEAASWDQLVIGDILDLPPSSPPKTSTRVRLSRCS